MNGVVMSFDYIDQTDAPLRNTGAIKLHGEDGFVGMRRVGHLAAETLDFIEPHIQPGVTTAHLDDLCHAFILDHGAIPAPLYYRGFPKAVCTSVNHVVCHGIPGDKVLRDGDLLNIDVTAILDGWHGDTNRTFFVGEVSVKARRLVQVTYDAMMKGIEMVRPGATLGDVGHAIQSHAEAERCSVVRDFCGHGLGRLFHDAPNVLHYGSPNGGIQLREGMFFTVEPMVNLGRWQVKLLKDGWTVVTKDRSLSAQFEHSIGVTATGHEIFTCFAGGPTSSALQLSQALRRVVMADKQPHYLGHRQRLRERFRRGGTEALADYEGAVPRS